MTVYESTGVIVMSIIEDGSVPANDKAYNPKGRCVSARLVATLTGGVLSLAVGYVVSLK